MSLLPTTLTGPEGRPGEMGMATGFVPACLIHAAPHRHGATAPVSDPGGIQMRQEPIMGHNCHSIAGKHGNMLGSGTQQNEFSRRNLVVLP